MHFVRIPWSWPLYSEAGYYGYRHGLAIGPMLLFWGRP